MQINKEYEAEVDVKDLIFDILYHWRSCFLLAFIFALVLGGLRYGLNLKDIGSASPLSALQEDNANLNNVENHQESASMYSRLLSGYSSYRSHSLLMQADPYQIWVVTAVYYIKPEEAWNTGDPADAALISYTTAIYDGLDPNRLREIYGSLDIQYLEELITVESDPEANCFTIRVRGLTEEMAKKAFSFVADHLLQFSAEKADFLPAHQLVLMSEYSSAIADKELELQQVAMAKNVTTYISAKTKADQETMNLSEEAFSPRPMHSVKKYVMLGFLFGGLSAVCFHALRYLFNQRLHNVRELSEAYGLPVYGVFSRSRARHPGKGIDQLLERCEFGSSKETDAAVFSSICSLLNKKFVGRNILFTSTLCEKELAPVISILNDQMGNSVSISLESSFLQSPTAIQTSSTADAVLLLEKKGTSSIREISRMAEMLTICGAHVEGVIVL